MAEANKLAIKAALAGKPVCTLVRETMERHNRIEDAARELGVSRQALSRYLNHRLHADLERCAAVGK